MIRNEQDPRASFSSTVLCFLDNAFGFEGLRNSMEAAENEFRAYANTILRLTMILPGGIALGWVGAKLLGVA